MHTYAHKASSPSTSFLSGERTEQQASFLPADNRPEAAVQRKLQEMAGNYTPPVQLKKNVPLNDDPQLEREADVMGAKALQAKAETPLKTVQPAVSNVMQAYTKNHGIKFSENDQYRVDEAASHQLLVNPHAPGPQPAGQFHTNGAIGGYTVYEFNGAYQNDCLGFAEYLKTGKYSSQPAFHAKDDEGRRGERLLGSSDEQNINIGKGESGGKKRKRGFSKGDLASPGIREAYATVRLGTDKGKCPYHIAAVVAQDGADNITCEADASDLARAVPVFDMYAKPKKVKKPGKKATTVTEGETFHKTYKHVYSTGPKGARIEPATGVLV
jgi:hypothetical protein